MNITEIWKNPKFSMSAMVRRMADRELDEAMRRAAKQAHADSLSETMIDVIRMDRELGEEPEITVSSELERLLDLKEEDLFGGAA